MSSSQPSLVYLDYNATTPVDGSVLEAMLPYFTAAAGNPSSGHLSGQLASDAVERARAQVAQLVGAGRGDVVFTGGATEANNLAILGAAKRAKSRRKIVSVTTEHPSVLRTLDHLRSEGFEIELVGVDRQGFVDQTDLTRAVDQETLLVTVSAANHEIGALGPIQLASRLAREHDALLHVDGAQAAGKTPIHVRHSGIDLLSISAHKLYGPKGIGALVASSRARARLSPQTHGGGQELGLRPGTLNVPGIVGFGEAADLARESMVKDTARLAESRELLLRTLRKRLPNLELNGPELSMRVPGNLNIWIPGVEADALVARCRQVALSSGSACAEGSFEPSPVLLALGLSSERAGQSIRMSVGRPTSRADIERAVDAVAAAAREILALQNKMEAA